MKYGLTFSLPFKNESDPNKTVQRLQKAARRTKKPSSKQNNINQVHMF